MRFYLAALFLIPVMLVFGCTGTVKIDTNNGLAVNDFAAEPATAEAGDTVRFYLDTENVGGTTASCVTSTLYGIDGWYDGLTGAPLSSTPLTIMPQNGLSINILNGGANFCYFDVAKGQQVCASYVQGQGTSLSAFIGNNFLAFSNQYCNQASIYANQMDANGRLVRFQPALTAPLPQQNKAGQSWQAEWILKPPLLPEGLKVDYPITARTEYFYKSNAQVNIKAFNKDEYRTRQITGDQSIVSSPLQIDNVISAPIQVVATRGDNPMVINQDQSLGPLEYFSYTFSLNNVGNGYPLSMSGSDIPGASSPDTSRGFVWAVATINGPGAAFSNCLGQSGSEIFISSDYVPLQIRSDKTAPFGCQIAIDRSQWVNRPFDTISITFQVFYRYYVDKETHVTVIGPQMS